LIVQRIREYATAAVATMSSSDGGAGKALLALRPSLEGSEAAAAAGDNGAAAGEILIGGSVNGPGGFVKMNSNQLAELLPKDTAPKQQGAELKAAQRVRFIHSVLTSCPSSISR
jgi:hypothetical protein